MITVGDLPSSIRVGPYDFTITIKDKLDNDEHGNCHLDAQEIQLRSTAPSPHFAADTVLHELIHAAWKVGGLPARATEEHVATVVATQLTQVFRDSPAILAWLASKVSPPPSSSA